MNSELTRIEAQACQATPISLVVVPWSILFMADDAFPPSCTVTSAEADSDMEFRTWNRSGQLTSMEHLNKGYPGCKNWPGRRQKTRRGLGSWGNELEKKKRKGQMNEKMKNSPNQNKTNQSTTKQKKMKQAKTKDGGTDKETETYKGRDEKRTRLKNTWTGFREFFRGLSVRLLRLSDE
jgi:hypothetical protein